VTAQRFEKWLKAAVDDATQDLAVNLDLADGRRALYLLEGRGADETDLHALDRELLGHAG